MALLTRMSTGPNCCSAASNKAAGAAGSDRSASTAKARPPAASDLRDDRRCARRGNRGRPAECQDRARRAPAGTCTGPRSPRGERDRGGGADAVVCAGHHRRGHRPAHHPPRPTPSHPVARNSAPGASCCQAVPPAAYLCGTQRPAKREYRGRGSVAHARRGPGCGESRHPPNAPVTGGTWPARYDSFAV